VGSDIMAAGDKVVVKDRETFRGYFKV
jgi:hypothetical protein